MLLTPASATAPGGAAPTLIEWLLGLYRQMEWADAEIWTATLACEAAHGDTVLRERLLHTHLVQQAFLAIWRGQPVDAEAGAGLDLAALAGWARAYYPGATEYLESLSPSSLAEPVALPWSSHVRNQLGLDPTATTLLDTLTQVYAHTAHHRGQIMLRLRALGVVPPLIDFIAWVWRGRPRAAWGTAGT